jgi:hypothetical protein
MNSPFSLQGGNLKAEDFRLSSSQAEQNFIQKRQIFTGLAGVVIQDPFSWIRVN